MIQTQYTTTSITDGIAVVTITRAQKYNALNKAVIASLCQAFLSLEKNKQVRAVILTGQGDKAFVAGADIAGFANFSKEQAFALAFEGQKQLFGYIATYPKPVIAAINGFALGGGLELAMACHLRIASTDARLGLPEVSLGLIPGYGGTQRLAELIGKARAMELILTADAISAQKALAYGLVSEVVPLDTLLQQAQSWAKKTTKNAPYALAKAIDAVQSVFNTAVDGYQKEIENFSDCFTSSDFKEGVTAFLEKRKPNFSTDADTPV